MNELINLIVKYFGLALVAIGSQNAIFARGLGLSSGIRMLNDPKKNIFYFCGSLTVFQLLTSIFVYLVMPIFDIIELSDYRRFLLPTVIVIACMLSYLLVIAILRAGLKEERFKDLLKSVTSASITSAIVGTVILTTSQGLNFVESIIFGLGSSVGYFIAMILIAEGYRKICHEKVPTAFQGLPITLIYISILALAIYGLTGHTIVL